MLLARLRHPIVRRHALSTVTTLTYPACPPTGRQSGRLMDPAIWPKISPIWPSQAFFEEDISVLHEEDDVRAVPVTDARGLHERPTLSTHGFEMVNAPTCVTDFDDEDQTGGIYLDEIRQLVMQVTGAQLAVPFHHIQIDAKRDAFGKRGGAVERIHGDYTQSSGPQMLEDLRERGVVPASTSSMRGAILNVWRNSRDVEVQWKALAMCDTRTVAPDDLGIYYLVEGGDDTPKRRMGQNLALHYSPDHAWYYYSRLNRDEALVFYTYDGRRPEEPRFTFHTAFDPPEAHHDMPERRAMIVRCAAFF